MIGVLAIPHAVAGAMEHAVTEYADAMTMDAASMREQYNGRIVLVGDLRGVIDRHTASGDIDIPGVFVHAAALEIVQRRAAIREPWGTGMAAVIVAAAMIGVICSTFAGSGAMKRTVVLGSAALIAAVVCVGVYYVTGFLCNPIIPAAAILLAGGLATLVPSETHTRIGPADGVLR